MSHGFTVSASSLAAGSQDIASLLGICEKISSYTATALSGMAEAAEGHPGLAAALIAATERGTKSFLDISASYAHTAVSLKAAGEAYDKAEQRSARKIAAIGGNRG